MAKASNKYAGVFALTLFFSAQLAAPLGSAVRVAFAFEATSTNYILRNAETVQVGGNATSAGFQLTGSGQVNAGESTSTNFQAQAGQLYFGTSTTPSAPTAPSDSVAVPDSTSQITLTWTDNSSNETGFKIERRTSADSDYAQISTVEANVVSYADSGLSSATTYIYRVRAYNSGGNSAYSGTASATTNSAATTNTGGSSGGGGGGAAVAQPTGQVIFSGKAYPGSEVTLLKDGQVAATTPAGPDANFEVRLNIPVAGSYIFGVWAKDTAGNRSFAQTFNINITLGATARVSGIFIAPTISLDKREVKRGDNLVAFGATVPEAQVTIITNSSKEIISKTAAGKDGAWLYKLDTSELEYGDHSIRAKSAAAGDISTFSNSLAFKVGQRNVLAEVQKAVAKGDINDDKRINLIDFSIAAYWHKRSNPPASADLNGDGKVDLRDFSIMAYFWTG